MARSKMSAEERLARHREANRHYKKKNHAKIVAYRQNTKEATRLRNAAYRAANLTKLREYRKANIIKIREQERVYREVNKESRAISMRAWRERNRDKIRQYRNDYSAANADKEKARSRAWREANRALSRKLALAWAKTHPEKAAILTARRRARKSGADGNFTIADWQTLVTRSPFCFWCKRPWTKKRKPTHDHIIPLTRHGPNTPENSVCACRECNSRKGNRRFHPVNGQGILI